MYLSVSVVTEMSCSDYPALRTKPWEKCATKCIFHVPVCMEKYFVTHLFFHGGFCKTVQFILYSFILVYNGKLVYV